MGWGGEESETSPFGSSKHLDVISWMLNAARVSAPSVGLFLLHHVNSWCEHPFSELEQLAGLAENESRHHVSPRTEKLQLDKQSHPALAAGLQGGLRAKARVLLTSIRSAGVSWNCGVSPS